jgi:hypothetical protein
MGVALAGDMIVKAGSRTALCLSVMSFLFTPAIAKQRAIESSNLSIFQFSYARTAHSQSPNSAIVSLTCNRDAIDRESYEMATIGQARALLTDRSDFWDAFQINRHIATLRELNLDTQELAERALARDARNLMAHSILARQYTILGWDGPAIDAWTRVVDNGGVVVWTATLYDADYKSYFLMSFGRDAVRIYRMGQFTGAIDRKLGYAKFPEPTEIAFYEATAGCPDRAVVPVATIRWSDVKEVRSGNWVLWFKLSKPVTIVSDREKKKTLSEIKVNLHGATGVVRILAEPNPNDDPRFDEDDEAFKNVRGIGLGPWDYNRRIRDMVLRFAEPTGHIKRTSTGKGAGW